MSAGGEVASATAVAVNNLRTFSLQRRISAGANTNEQQQAQPRCINRSVCRNLFGTTGTDRDENRRFVEDQLGRLRIEQTHRWNFDFESETPLPGRYEWEPMMTTTTSSECVDDDDAQRTATQHLHGLDEDGLRVTTAGKQRQTTMTAYFPQRKRMAADAPERIHIDASKLMDTTALHVTTSAADAATSPLVVTAGVVSKKAKP